MSRLKITLEWPIADDDDGVALEIRRITQHVHRAFGKVLCGLPTDMKLPRAKMYVRLSPDRRFREVGDV